MRKMYEHQGVALKKDMSHSFELVAMQQEIVHKLIRVTTARFFLSLISTSVSTLQLLSLLSLFLQFPPVRLKLRPDSFRFPFRVRDEICMLHRDI